MHKKVNLGRSSPLKFGSKIGINRPRLSPVCFQYYQNQSLDLGFDPSHPFGQNPYFHFFLNEDLPYSITFNLKLMHENQKKLYMIYEIVVGYVVYIKNNLFRDASYPITNAVFLPTHFTEGWGNQRLDMIDKKPSKLELSDTVQCTA